jgi:hypothetical protein
MQPLLIGLAIVCWLFMSQHSVDGKYVEGHLKTLDVNGLSEGWNVEPSAEYLFSSVRRIGRSWRVSASSRDVGDTST